MEKITTVFQSLEATNRDLLKKFNEKTAELNESIKINNKLLAKVNVFQSYVLEYSNKTKSYHKPNLFRLILSRNWRLR